MWNHSRFWCSLFFYVCLAQSNKQTKQTLCHLSLYIRYITIIQIYLQKYRIMVTNKWLFVASWTKCIKVFPGFVMKYIHFLAENSFGFITKSSCCQLNDFPNISHSQLDSCLWLAGSFCSLSFVWFQIFVQWHKTELINIFDINTGLND